MDRASEHLKRCLEETARENKSYWEERDADLLLALTRCAHLRAIAGRQTAFSVEAALRCGDHCLALARVWEIVREYRSSSQPLPELADKMLAAEAAREAR